MKKLIFILFLCFGSGPTFSQWIANYGYSEGDANLSNCKGNAITTDNTGCSYVTGTSFEGSNNFDIITIKYNPNGDTAWARTFNGSASDNDEGTGICTDLQGNVYVVGTAQSVSRYKDITILKYDPNGNLQWVNYYYGDGGYRDDRGFGIAIDYYSNIYITGYSTNSAGIQNIVTQKYSRNGYLKWSQVENYSGFLNGTGNRIVISNYGNVYVCGSVTTASSGSDIAVFKYSNYSGARYWYKTINGSGSGEDKGWGIVVDESDNCIVTGYTTEANGFTDAYTAKLFYYNGDIIWSKTFNGNGSFSDKAWGIVVDTDGSIIICGETTDETNNINYLCAKYSAAGNLLWGSQVYNGTGNGTDAASSLAVLTDLSGNKSVVVTGKSMGETNTFDYATIRYNFLTGNIEQVNRYSFSGNSVDIANSLTVSTDRTVLITGYSELIQETSSNISYISTQSLNWGFNSQLITGNSHPDNYSLFQNYPNPFNPATTIKFDIPRGNNVKLVVYDILGRVCSVLIDHYLSAGSYNISFANPDLPSGIYFYELSAGNFREVKKMSLLK